MSSQERINNIYINNIINCFFYKISFNNAGGSIFINNISLSIIISQCMFYECFTTLNGGGAIYINSKSFKIDKTCGYSCFTPYPSSYDLNLGQFSSNIVQTNQANEINFLSIAYCSPISGTNNGSPLYVENGIQNIINSNISKSQVYVRSAGLYRYSQNLTMIYSTIDSNYAIWVDSIVFWGGNGYLLFSNIINNTQGTTNLGGIVRGYQINSMNVFKCNLLDNSNRLFSVTSGSQYILECFIKGTYSIENAIVSNCFTFSLTYQLKHFSSYFCFAQINSSLFLSKKFIFSKLNYFFLIFNILLE